MKYTNIFGHEIDTLDSDALDVLNDRINNINKKIESHYKAIQKLKNEKELLEHTIKKFNNNFESQVK